MRRTDFIKTVVRIIITSSITLIVMSLLPGCATGVTDYEWRRACIKCESNEGVTYVDHDMGGLLIMCHDGTFHRE